MLLTKSIGPLPTLTVLSRAVPPPASYGWQHLVADISWPVVAIVAIIFIYFGTFRVFGAKWLRHLAGKVKRLKVFQVEIELTEPAASETKRAVEDVFIEYRDVIHRAMDRAVNAQRVDLKFDQTCEQVAALLTPPADAQIRFTIHTPDLLLVDGLYQLVDYYPSGSGAGRAFSTRYGVIGLAWRSGKSRVQNDVDPDPSALIVGWGMTREQARSAGEGRKSFAAIIIPDAVGSPLALFYIDGKPANCFVVNGVTETEFVRRVVDVITGNDLNGALEACIATNRGGAPLIQIFGDR